MSSQNQKTPQIPNRHPHIPNKTTHITLAEIAEYTLADISFFQDPEAFINKKFKDINYRSVNHYDTGKVAQFDGKSFYPNGTSYFDLAYQEVDEAYRRITGTNAPYWISSPIVVRSLLADLDILEGPEKWFAFPESYSALCSIVTDHMPKTWSIEDTSITDMPSILNSLIQVRKEKMESGTSAHGSSQLIPRTE